MVSCRGEETDTTYDQWDAWMVYVLFFASLPAALIGCWMMAPALDELPMIAMAIPFILLAAHRYRHIPMALIVTAVALASHLGLARVKQAHTRDETGVEVPSTTLGRENIRFVHVLSIRVRRSRKHTVARTRATGDQLEEKRPICSTG